MTQPERRGTHIPRDREPSLGDVLELFDSIPALFWETDLDLRLQSLFGTNAAAKAAEYAGKCVTEAFAGATCPVDLRRAHEEALSGRSGRFLISLGEREFEGSVKPRRSPDGTISGAIAIAVDVTERRFAERAWRSSEYSYRSFVEAAPYAICSCTTGGAMLQVNPAMAGMLGYSGAATSELLLLDLPAVFRPPESFETLRRVLVENGSYPQTDACWLRRDGQPIHVRVSGRVVRDPAGHLSHFDLFAEDVTEKARLEAELTRAQKMQAVGQLAGGIAHDFNNLLTVIAGHVDLLLAGTAGIDSREALREVKEAAARAAALTGQLLAFGRRQVLHKRNVNLNDVIAKLKPLLARLIRENVAVRFEPCDDRLANINADPNEIERVLVNLAVNAQDAMPEGGQLTIRTQHIRVAKPDLQPGEELDAGEYVSIAVSDTGIGMNLETQNRVFEPFFSTKGPDRGAGLGLAVVYGVVRQSGGFIRVESALGQGSTFTVYLPLAAGRAELEQPPSRAASLPRGNETILIAEDDAAIQVLATQILKTLGYTVINAPDGAIALEMMESHGAGVDLLLSDVVMPGMSGLELANRLKESMPELNVILMSGYAADMLSGADLERLQATFLQKPFSIETLSKTVRRVLDASRRRSRSPGASDLLR